MLVTLAGLSLFSFNVVADYVYNAMSGMRFRY